MHGNDNGFVSTSVVIDMMTSFRTFEKKSIFHNYFDEVFRRTIHADK